MSKEHEHEQEREAFIVIDMNKFPEEIRDKLPKDLQEKLIELFQKNQIQKEPSDEKTKSSGLFAIQQGYVVGNIYKDKNLS